MESKIVESSAPDSNPDPEIQNRATVESLYKALSQGDTSTVTKLVAGDLEWWFHGPPRCQHMMRLLTGEPPSLIGFRFEPISIEAIRGGCVVVEGWVGSQVYWVHVWKLRDGCVTELREYFNTWITVRDCKARHRNERQRQQTLWESLPKDLARRSSLPGLLLAI